MPLTPEAYRVFAFFERADLKDLYGRLVKTRDQDLAPMLILKYTCSSEWSLPNEGGVKVERESYKGKPLERECVSGIYRNSCV